MDEILRRLYADDDVANPLDAAAKLLPKYSRTYLQFKSSTLGFARERRERRERLGINRKPKPKPKAKAVVERDPAGAVILPWRMKRTTGNVRPVMCPGCGEAFAVDADDLARA